MASCRQDPLPIADSHARELAAGQRLFERHCASCHNTNGDGRTTRAARFPYANLIDGVWRGDGSPGAIARQIRRGHDPMPKFEGKLSEEEIRETAAYVLERAHRGEQANVRAGTAQAQATR